MHPFLRFGVELPPVPVSLRSAAATGASRFLEPWWQMAETAASAGAGVIWMSGGGAAAPPGPDLACDACTIIAAAVPLLSGPLLGVVSDVPVDRHPALVARDATALDVLSGGRAAVRLRWVGRTPAGPATPAEPAGYGGSGTGHSAALEHLGEAVAVCRAVMQDEDPVFEGKHLHVAGAVNRPRPQRQDGPPLVVDAPAGTAVLARRDEVAAFFVRQVLVGAAAVACSDEPEEIEAWRAAVDDAAATVWGPSRHPARPAVLCRTALGPTGADAEDDRSDADEVSVLARLELAHAAGAQGVIVRIAGDRRDDPPPRGLGAHDRLAVVLGQWFSPWRS